MPLLIALLFTCSATGLIAECKDGTVASCSLRGQTGKHECINGRWSACEVETPPPPPPPPPPPLPSANGFAAPKYYILTVIYAPPGTNGGGSTSAVSYKSGSTTGSTASANNSFKQNYSVSASANFGVDKNNAQIGATFEYQQEQTGTSAFQITKAKSAEITLTGPSVDGVDHNRDQIWLWLNPRVSLTLLGSSLNWTLQDTGTADILYVYVGHLKDPTKMPVGVANRLRMYGLTTEDYAQILLADPFASGNPAVDERRYQSLSTTFPYEPPYAPGDAPSTYRVELSNSTALNSSAGTENEYTVGVSLSGEMSFLDLIGASLKAAGKWTWTSGTTSNSSTGTTESASLIVGGPAFGYTGPTTMRVYYDRIYKTFLFEPFTGQMGFKGSVRSRSGQILSGREVMIMGNGQTYRTFTNEKGEYRIPEWIIGPATVKVGGVEKTALQSGSTFDIELP